MASSQQDPRAAIIARAWKDPAFKKRLLENPRAVLHELGYLLPASMKVRVIEEAADTFTFVLPTPPTSTQKLSEAELTKIAAAAPHQITTLANC